MLQVSKINSSIKNKCMKMTKKISNMMMILLMKITLIVNKNFKAIINRISLNQNDQCMATLRAINRWIATIPI